MKYCCVVILLLTITLLSCFRVDRKARALEPISFGEMWKSDSCGTEGYRKAFVNYYEHKTTITLIGKSLNYVEEYFGSPNYREVNDSTLLYTYITDAYPANSTNCGEAINLLLLITFDHETELVIDVITAIPN